MFQLNGQTVRTISAVMRFDTAVEVTTSQLRIELMFPADDAAEAFFRGHVPGRPPGGSGTAPVPQS